MRFLDKHTSRDKQLRRLDRELSRLSHAQWKAPLVPLEHPIQRGWMKTYVLREDVRRRPDAAVFAAVLAVVNVQIYARNRSFLSRNGQPMPFGHQIVPMWRWRRLNWPLSHQSLFSYGVWPRREERPVPRCRRGVEIGFKLFRDWWLQETVQPWFVTHQRVDLPEVRRRVAEIEAHMRSTLGWERLRWLNGYSDRWRRLVASPADLRAAEETD